jgi:hypothetical protein
MAKRYGHIGHTARRHAVDKLANATAFDVEGTQKWAQWQEVVAEGGAASYRKEWLLR